MKFYYFGQEPRFLALDGVQSDKMRYQSRSRSILGKAKGKVQKAKWAGTKGVLPGQVIRLSKGCMAHGVYGGMWHFKRQGNQTGLTVCGIVVNMSGTGYAVWEEADLCAGMWGRVCAGCRGPLVALEEGEPVTATGRQLDLFETGG